jgi:hypothetical protein
MAAFASVARLAPAVLALAAFVSACDKPKPRPAKPAEVANAGLPAGAAPAGQAGPQSTQDPLPGPPEWAAGYMGKTFAELFPDQNGQCIGNTDDVNLYYRGATQGLRVEGWGWSPAAKAPVARVLLVDDGGKVVGAGETGKPRPDVVAARKDITSPTTGWQAVTAKTTGGVYAFGLMPDGKQVCRLGHLNL